MPVVSKPIIRSYNKCPELDVIFNNILESFYHKEEGIIIESITEQNNDLTITFSNGETKNFSTVDVVDSLNSDSDLIALSAKQGKALKKLVDNLTENQITGVIVVQNYTDLPDPGVTEVSYKVAKDSTDSDLNGYYHWTGSVYQKDADLVENTIDPDNNSVGVSGKAVYNFIKNRSFINNPDISDLEAKIQASIFSVQIYGNVVEPTTQEFYLARLGRNRDSYNDNYFQLKLADGTLIAFNQWDFDPVETSGIKTYFIENYASLGYKFKFSINWDLIPEGTNYTTGSLDTMKFDPSKCHIAKEKSLEDLPLLNLKYINNSCFKRDDNITHTPEEQNILNAVLRVEIYGKYVDSAATYFLHKMGYDRSGANDIVFQVKKDDGSANGELIAHLQIPKTESDTGVKKYVINNYIDGNNVLIVVNWAFIDIGMDYEDGAKENMAFDNNLIHIQQTKKEEFFTENKVLRKGDKVYIVSNWNNEYDILITFNKCMFNELMTFSGVYLVDNKDFTLIEEFTKPPAITLNNVDSDNIGPYKITGRGDWIGGNHGIEGELVNLSANYTNGDSVLNIVDGTKFVASGGHARTDGNNGYLKFQYTGVTGNQLTGVTGLNTDLTASDQIQIYHKTAETLNFEFYVNGEVLPENVVLPADELLVAVKNKVLDSDSLNYSDGSIDTALYEKVMYRVSKGNIEVLLQNEFTKDISLNVYYGMQLLSASWQQKVYQANSQDTAVKGKADYINNSTPLRSGDPFVHESDTMIISKSNEIYNCAMWFDPNCGYSQNKANYLDAADYLWNGETNGKFYHGTILKEVSFVAGQKEWWRGVYTWFPNPLTINTASYAYEMRLAGKKYLCVDFHSAGSDVVPTKTELGKAVEQIRVSESLTADNIIMPEGLEVSASGYGRGLFKIKE